VGCSRAHPCEGASLESQRVTDRRASFWHPWLHQPRPARHAPHALERGDGLYIEHPGLMIMGG
jgi:hypothetical protein